MPVSVAHPADLKVLTSVALTSVLDELAPAFEKATGNKLAIEYGLAAVLKKRILDGETADVIVLTRPMMDDLQMQDKFATNSLVNAAGTPVAVAARAGAPKPDIGSVDAFKHTLLTARSIVYADPAKGGVSGVVFCPRARSPRDRRSDAGKDHLGAGRPSRGGRCQGRSRTRHRAGLRNRACRWRAVGGSAPW